MPKVTYWVLDQLSTKCTSCMPFCLASSHLVLEQERGHLDEKYDSPYAVLNTQKKINPQDSQIGILIFSSPKPAGKEKPQHC